MSDKQPVPGERGNPLLLRKGIHRIRLPRGRADLPSWSAPANVDAAKSAIDRLVRETLGTVEERDINFDWDLEKIRVANEVSRLNNNNRYLAGRYIAWARRELGRGHFNKWVREHLRGRDWNITVDGARGLMRLASRSTDRGYLSVRTVIPSRSQVWWTEAERERFRVKRVKIRKRRKLRKLRKMEASDER